MYKRKRIISLTLVFALFIANLLPIFAHEQVVYPYDHEDEIHLVSDECNELCVRVEPETETFYFYPSEETNLFEIEFLENIPESFYYFPEHELPFEPMEHELDFINRFMDKDFEDISYSDVLYDVNSLPTYLLVEFQLGGYVIMLRTTFRIIELKYSGHNPYWDYQDEKKVFVGALNYLLKVEEDFIDFEGEIISDEVITILQEYQEFVLEDSLEISQEAFTEFIEMVDTLQLPHDISLRMETADTASKLNDFNIFDTDYSLWEYQEFVLEDSMELSQEHLTENNEMVDAPQLFIDISPQMVIANHPKQTTLIYQILVSYLINHLVIIG